MLPIFSFSVIMLCHLDPIKNENGQENILVICLDLDKMCIYLPIFGKYCIITIFNIIDLLKISGGT